MHMVGGHLWVIGVEEKILDHSPSYNGKSVS